MKKRGENGPMVRVMMFQEVENRGNDMWAHTMTDKWRNLAMKASRHDLELAVSIVEMEKNRSVLASV